MARTPAEQEAHDLRKAAKKAKKVAAKAPEHVAAVALVPLADAISEPSSEPKKDGVSKKRKRTDAEEAVEVDVQVAPQSQDEPSTVAERSSSAHEKKKKRKKDGKDKKSAGTEAGSAVIAASQQGVEQASALESQPSASSKDQKEKRRSKKNEKGKDKVASITDEDVEMSNGAAEPQIAEAQSNGKKERKSKRSQKDGKTTKEAANAANGSDTAVENQQAPAGLQEIPVSVVAAPVETKEQRKARKLEERKRAIEEATKAMKGGNGKGKAVVVSKASSGKSKNASILVSSSTPAYSNPPPTVPAHLELAAHDLATKWLTPKDHKALSQQYSFTPLFGPFTASETAQLASALSDFATQHGLDESELAALVSSNRTQSPLVKELWTFLAPSVPMRPMMSVYKHVKRKYGTSHRMGKWTAQEISDLKAGIAEHGTSSWTKISERVGRQPGDCRDWWRENMGSRKLESAGGVIRLGKWDEEEVKKLKKAVRKLGTDKWAEVARKVGTRSWQQCRTKWAAVEFGLDDSTSRLSQKFRPALLCAVLRSGSDSMERTPWIEVARDPLLPIEVRQRGPTKVRSVFKAMLLEATEAGVSPFADQLEWLKSKYPESLERARASKAEKARLRKEKVRTGEDVAQKSKEIILESDEEAEDELEEEEDELEEEDEDEDGGDSDAEVDNMLRG